MKLWSLLPLLFAAIMLLETSTSAAEPTVYEMRTYTVAPGKMEALHARFRDHTLRLAAKHGMGLLGFWVPVDEADQRVIFVLSYPSREARENMWKAFGEDPEWIKAKADSEKDGKLVTKAEQRFMTATDFSPEIKAGAGAAPRVFELRTYTTPPSLLPNLQARFRDHTMNLFAKHGMTNLFYWQLMPDQPAADVTLVYLLAHASPEAGLKSFTSFRADPIWIAAKKASEDKAGGSLTVAENGVVSLYLKATDYSPTK